MDAEGILDQAMHFLVVEECAEVGSVVKAYVMYCNNDWEPRVSCVCNSEVAERCCDSPDLELLFPEL